MNLKPIKTIIQFNFLSVVSVYFLLLCIFILVHDTLAGESSVTEEYCAE